MNNVGGEPIWYGNANHIPMSLNQKIQRNKNAASAAGVNPNAPAFAPQSTLNPNAPEWVPSQGGKRKSRRSKKSKKTKKSKKGSRKH